MGSYVSLITTSPQLIDPDTYTAINFDDESSDVDNWHPYSGLTDPRSALITPKLTAYAMLCGEIFWEDPLAVARIRSPRLLGETTAEWNERLAPELPSQYQSRFTRDPYTSAIDSTCTEDRAPTPGGNFMAKSWAMTVRTGQPLALMVAHTGNFPLKVTLAEFKVWVP